MEHLHVYMFCFRRKICDKTYSYWRVMTFRQSVCLKCVIEVMLYELEWMSLKPLDTFGKQYCPMPTLRASQLIYITWNLWKFRLNWSSESGENNGKTHPCFRTFRSVITCVKNKSVFLDIENWYCFNVFSKSKAFHGIIFQEKSFTITFCKPKLFANLWTLFFFSVPKVSNGFYVNLKIENQSRNIDFFCLFLHLLLFLEETKLTRKKALLV